MRRILIALIRLYQMTLSVVFGPRCRFYPSCSAYFIEALEKHGVIRGGGMGVARICRCHPWHPGGYDPVPDRKVEEEGVTFRASVDSGDPSVRSG